MIRFLRDVRLVPVVLAATICLFALKTFGLVFDGGYTLNELGGRDADDVGATGAVGAPKRPEAAAKVTAPSPAKSPSKSWAQQMFNYPDVTGAVAEPKPTPQAAPKGDAPKAKPQEPPTNPSGTVVATDQRVPSRAERAILERLQERRIELDARARDLDMRESLLKAAEKRLEARINELKDAESKLTTAVQQKDEAEAARLKNVVTMYENMKAKDAAKIFDRLDPKVLLDVATQINPRRMSDIMAQMAPEAAERLTVELAMRAKDNGRPAELPKIEGKPTN
jgi:flagellar motility protein MotE (MotC chaperone)